MNFREEIADGSISGDQYHDFLKQYSPYLNIEKPSFISNLKFFFEYQLGYMYMALLQCGILLDVKTTNKGNTMF